MPDWPAHGACKAVPCMVSAARVAAALVSLSTAVPAFSQENYEIQVYPSETVAPGATMVELHSNFAFQGMKTAEAGVRPANHALHETLEVTHGFTDWFEIGFYVF